MKRGGGQCLVVEVVDVDALGAEVASDVVVAQRRIVLPPDLKTRHKTTKERINYNKKWEGGRGKEKGKQKRRGKKDGESERGRRKQKKKALG